MEESVIKYYLIGSDNKYTFYGERNDSQLVLKLAYNGFAYAIKMILSANNYFSVNNVDEFIKDTCSFVAPFYRELSVKRDSNGQGCKVKETQEKQIEWYENILLNYDEETVEKELYAKSTDELLIVFRRYHENCKDKNDGDKKYHDEYEKKIQMYRKKIKELLADAEKYIADADVKSITEMLTSNEYDEHVLSTLTKDMNKQSKKVFCKDYFIILLENSKNSKWIEFYVEKALLCEDVNLIEFFSIGLENKLNNSMLVNIFGKLDDDKKYSILRKIDDKQCFEALFEYYLLNVNNSQEASELVDYYFDEFGVSGDSIYNVVHYIDAGKVTINHLAERIKKRAVKRFIEYCNNGSDNEIATIVEILDAQNTLDELTYDICFWKKLADNNSFSCIVEHFAEVMGYDRGYAMIRHNIVVAREFSMNKLLSVWIRAANNIAIQHEEAISDYGEFVVGLVGGNVLDKRSSDRFLKETINVLTEEVHKAKKRIEQLKMEKRDVDKNRVKDIRNSLKMPLDQLEMSIISYSDGEGDIDEIMSILRKQFGELRKGLIKLGVATTVDINDWVNMNAIEYISTKHNYSTEINDGEKVICQTMGTRIESMNYPDKAVVRKYIREE